MGLLMELDSVSSVSLASWGEVVTTLAGAADSLADASVSAPGARWVTTAPESGVGAASSCTSDGGSSGLGAWAKAGASALPVATSCLRSWGELPAGASGNSSLTLSPESEFCGPAGDVGEGSELGSDFSALDLLAGGGGGCLLGPLLTGALKFCGPIGRRRRRGWNADSILALALNSASL